MVPHVLLAVICNCVSIAKCFFCGGEANERPVVRPYAVYVRLFECVNLSLVCVQKSTNFVQFFYSQRMFTSASKFISFFHINK